MPLHARLRKTTSWQLCTHGDRCCLLWSLFFARKHGGSVANPWNPTQG
jgi:hypothetical protein